MVKVYLYDEETKEYTKEQEARIDPLETQIQKKNVYLLPANATFDKPTLKDKKGYAIGFDKEKKKWTYIPDYRGKKYYDEKGVNDVKKVGYLKEGQTLITEEQQKLIEENKLIWEDGKLIEFVEPTQNKIDEKETEIDMINNQIVRDLRVLNSSSATDEEKEEAQKYLEKKLTKIEGITEEIAELKKQQLEEMANTKTDEQEVK